MDKAVRRVLRGAQKWRDFITQFLGGCVLFDVRHTPTLLCVFASMASTHTVVE